MKTINLNLVNTTVVLEQGKLNWAILEISDGLGYKLDSTNNTLNVYNKPTENNTVIQAGGNITITNSIIVGSVISQGSGNSISIGSNSSNNKPGSVRIKVPFDPEGVNLKANLVSTTLHGNNIGFSKAYVDSVSSPSLNLKAKDLYADITGSTSADFEISGGRVTIDSVGSSSISLNGVISEGALDLTGSVKVFVNAQCLCKLDVEKVGNCKIFYSKGE